MKKDINEIMIDLKKVANKEYYVEDLFCYEECQILYDFILDLQKYYNDNVNKYEELIKKYGELIEKYTNLQEKKIPEKLKLYTPYSECEDTRFEDVKDKINEIIDYLKSKDK